MSRLARINCIIHGASVSAAGVGAGLAQVPGSDSLLIIPIQMAMIKLIASEHGKGFTEATALSIIATQATTMAGRKVSQFLVGWIPGPGNAINASTAAALTEAIGWVAHNLFSSDGGSS